MLKLSSFKLWIITSNTCSNLNCKSKCIVTIKSTLQMVVTDNQINWYKINTIILWTNTLSTYHLVKINYKDTEVLVYIKVCIVQISIIIKVINYQICKIERMFISKTKDFSINYSKIRTYLIKTNNNNQYLTVSRNLELILMNHKLHHNNSLEQVLGKGLLQLKNNRIIKIHSIQMVHLQQPQHQFQIKLNS